MNAQSSESAARGTARFSIAAERAKLIARGVAVGAVRHKDPVETWVGGWSTGLDPRRRDYASFARP